MTVLERLHLRSIHHFRELSQPHQSWRKGHLESTASAACVRVCEVHPTFRMDYAISTKSSLVAYSSVQCGPFVPLKWYKGRMPNYQQKRTETSKSSNTNITSQKSILWGSMYTETQQSCRATSWGQNPRILASISCRNSFGWLPHIRLPVILYTDLTLKLKRKPSYSHSVACHLFPLQYVQLQGCSLCKLSY
jgi:hypothetical protein